MLWNSPHAVCCGEPANTTAKHHSISTYLTHHRAADDLQKRGVYETLNLCTTVTGQGWAYNCLLGSNTLNKENVGICTVHPTIKPCAPLALKSKHASDRLCHSNWRACQHYRKTRVVLSECCVWLPTNPLLNFVPKITKVIMYRQDWLCVLVTLSSVSHDIVVNRYEKCVSSYNGCVLALVWQWQ